MLVSDSTTYLISAHETCNDKIKNQDETDVDCGGIICLKCNNTMVCKNATDCLSNTCKNKTCICKGLTSKSYCTRTTTESQYSCSIESFGFIWKLSRLTEKILLGIKGEPKVLVLLRKISFSPLLQIEKFSKLGI